MQIQFNTHDTKEETEVLRDPFIQYITDSLSRFSERVTRVEVHLDDENGSNKNANNDKRCMMEARMEGIQPLAVTNHADTYDLAVKGAIDKLKSVLDKTIERLQKH